MFCFVTPVQPWNLAVKRTMKEQVIGMEVASVLNIFNCSLHTQGICCTKYLGNGDSKAYKGWLRSPLVQKYP